MAWTGNPSTTDSSGRFAAAQLINEREADLQGQRAARVVAGRAIDAIDCAEMLAMLGLDVPAQRRSRY
jgi:hypothetical protein